MPDRTCVECETSFAPKSAQSKFCSDRCRYAKRDRGKSYDYKKTLRCAVCAEPMWQSPSSKPQGEAICHPCRRTRRAADELAKGPGRGRTPWTEGACQVCGVSFSARTIGGNTPTICSPECRGTNGNARGPLLTCEWCGHGFRRTCSTQITCSKACAMARRWRDKATPLKWATCRRCDGLVVGNKNRKRLCTACAHIPIPSGYVRKSGRDASLTCECGASFITTIQRGMTTKRCETCRLENERLRSYETRARRRARLANVEHEVIYRKKVYERDGWCCGICGEPLDRDAKVPDPWAPTLDHVVAIANGGAHTYANVQAAHFWCNSVKSDTDVSWLKAS